LIRIVEYYNTIQSYLRKLIAILSFLNHDGRNLDRHGLCLIYQNCG
jgi:hypothetical protein